MVGPDTSTSFEHGLHGADGVARIDAIRKRSRSHPPNPSQFEESEIRSCLVAPKTILTRAGFYEIGTTIRRIWRI